MKEMIEKYVKKNTNIFDNEEKLEVTEISDGNINFVFRVKSSDRSVIVKYSTDRIRTSNNPLSTDRSRIEMNALIYENSVISNCTPNIYHKDPDKCIIVMEDIGDHENLRYALMNEEMFSTLSSDMVDFLTRTLLLSSDIVMDPIKKKEKQKEFVNPMLCKITERLVFSEPYDEYENTNILSKENEKFFVDELYHDKKLKLEVAKLKNKFKNYAQSLLHGDLHTGSIFVKEGSTKILDPEFAFYGPAGYDIGNVIANIIFSYIRSKITNKNNIQFQSWCEDTIMCIIDSFKKEGKKILNKEITDRICNGSDFIDYYIDDIVSDSVGMCGTELIRRTVGDSKVKDITEIENTNSKAKAERICVKIGKCFIMNRLYIKDGDDLLIAIRKIVEEEND